MAMQVSPDKIFVGLKIPNKNHKLLESYVAQNGGTISGYINEAVYEWLKARGLEAEVSIDGRTGKWIRVDGREKA
ncbi:hypothetical protein SDC9_202492 [bioreactor metagenome]|uniref:Uncharacterized protein n=1 Tax=bioreactor metagenome TaxID=1076179 RepID=A0A645ITR8_9ZZZZ